MTPRKTKEEAVAEKVAYKAEAVAEKVAIKVTSAADVAKKQAVFDKNELLDAIESRLNNKQFGTRIDRVEEFLYYGNGDSLKQWMAITSTKLDSVMKSTDLIAPLKESVELHHAEPHIWKWVKSPKFWIILFVILTAISTVASYLPNIWNLGATLLGVPNLTIPLK